MVQAMLRALQPLLPAEMSEMLGRWLDFRLSSIVVQNDSYSWEVRYRVSGLGVGFSGSGGGANEECATGAEVAVDFGVGGEAVMGNSRVDEDGPVGGFT